MEGAKDLAMRARWIATLVVILGVWATPVTAKADGAAGHAAGADRLDFAPIVSTVLTRPTPVKATDGRFHIVYEVVLTNNTPYTMAVEDVKVRDAHTREVWRTSRGRPWTRT